jgi:zeaxanthin glucosyltransferase
VKTLVVSPDYLSHYLPLSALGSELRRRGHDVVVATGRALAPRVRADGFRHRELALGRGGNAGVWPADDLDRFFAATRRGAVATLRHQALARRRDLLWQPVQVTRRLEAVLAAEDPDCVVSDQLAYGATLALRALRRDHVSVVVGHPSALPAGAEVFGVPSSWPPGLEPAPPGLAALERLCREVEERFTEAFNRTLRRLGGAPVASAFRATSSSATLVNYPQGLAGGRPGLHVGSLVRRARLDAELAAALDRLPRPRVYVALGTFLSARSDVLARLAAGVGRAGASLVLASGATPPEALPGLPHGVVRQSLPQAAVLPHCDAVVCHGGNGTVTESLTAGLPLLVAPFSSDQFAGAASLVEAGLGEAVDPNRAAPEDVAVLLRSLLDGRAAELAAAVGRALRAEPGPEIAAGLLERLYAAPARAVA